MATEQDTTRTNRTRTFTDTWLKGKTVLTASEWADKPSPGLRLRVSPKGKKTFFYRYKLNGKTGKVTIGTYRPVPDPEKAFTLKNARAKWGEYSNLRRQGINPRTHLEEQAEKERQAKLEQAHQESATVARLVNDYVKHISRDRKSWQETDAILKRSLERFMTRQADELTRGNVRDVLAKLRDANKPVMANRTLAAIRAMFNWAIKKDWSHQGVLTMNPAWQIEATKEKPRQRVLNDKELRKVLKKLPTSGLSEAVQDVLLFTLLTGCRIGEVCSMQWAHVHDDEWRLPGELTKNGREHTVYLSEQAQTILARHTGGAHVFDNPNTRHGHVHQDTVSMTLRRALGVDIKVPEADRKNRLGVETFHIHDLRRTMTTWLGENEVDERVHDRMLNHFKNTIRAVYNTARYNRPAREWWTNWGNHIQALGADNVIPLKGRVK